jgi:hypothetical protein
MPFNNKLHLKFFYIFSWKRFCLKLYKLLLVLINKEYFIKTRAKLLPDKKIEILNINKAFIIIEMIVIYIIIKLKF